MMPIARPPGDHHHRLGDDAPCDEPSVLRRNGDDREVDVPGDSPLHQLSGKRFGDAHVDLWILVEIAWQNLRQDASSDGGAKARV